MFGVIEYFDQNVRQRVTTPNSHNPIQPLTFRFFENDHLFIGAGASGCSRRRRDALAVFRGTR